MMGVQGLIGISMGVSWTMLWLLGVALLIVATTEHLDEGHVKELSCGHLFYRTFHLDPKRSVLYVGAMDRVLRLNLNNINQTSCKGDSAFLQATNVAGCVSRGKSEDYDCRNHIRVIQPMGDGSRLYICGTNAHNPKDWVLYSNLTHLAREVHIPGIGNGVAKCPFDPSDNSTAVWVEHGNPGGLPGLYSGTVAEFTKADTVIFRTDLFDPRLNNGKPEFTFKRTVKYDSKWLDKPNFVGSYEIGEYVYFFFRETAVEYINCGKNIYSRVARVCKRDTGGKNVLHQNWATYLKARLNCSIPGEFPFYFNEIQGIYKLRGDNTTFYAVFTTSMNGLMGSAICTYTIEDIQAAFLGRFKEQSSSSSAWLPVLSSLVPEPRPGECVNDTRTLPDTVLNFIRSHPLMDEAVAQKNGRPVFYKRDLIFTHLVVDKMWTDANGKRQEYTVYFVGSHDGRVYKIVEWYNREKGSQSKLLDMFQTTTPHPIRAMEISPEHKSIYVSSDYQMHQLSVEMCTGRYESCVRCVQDPYCGWDTTNHICKPYRSGHVQDVSGSVPGICQTHAHHENIEVNWGQSLHLGCTIKMSELLDYRDVTWFRHSRDKRILITPSRDKYVMTSDHGLVILGVSEEDMGRYDCVTGGVSLCRYNVSVNNHRCTAPDKVQDYQRIYSDWCQQFDKYKMALKSWQSRQLQCGLQHNKTYDKTNLLA